jgi:hypothetical protein
MSNYTAPPCSLNGTVYNSTTDCLAKCLQPTLFFSSGNTIDQCLSLAAYGNAYEIYDDEVVYGINSYCNTSAASPLVQLFDTCMQNYCQQEDEELGGCNYTSISTTICSNNSIWLTLCGNVSASVNADIGGIGVSPLITGV